MQMEMLKNLMAHAVGQFGLDRVYTVQFSTGGPIVEVYENLDQDDARLCALWVSDDVIQEKKFY